MPYEIAGNDQHEQNGHHLKDESSPVRGFLQSKVGPTLAAPPKQKSQEWKRNQRLKELSGPYHRLASVKQLGERYMEQANNKKALSGNAESDDSKPQQKIHRDEE